MSYISILVNGATTPLDIRPVSSTNPMPVVASTGTPSEALAAAFVRGLKAPASAGTPEALAADGTYVTTVTLWAKRAARVANTGSVWIDSVSTNDAQFIELEPGAYITFTAPAGKFIDLNDLYVDSVTVGDGVFFLGMR